jgi:hypothetical protein
MNSEAMCAGNWQHADRMLCAPGRMSVLMQARRGSQRGQRPPCRGRHQQDKNQLYPRKKAAKSGSQTPSTALQNRESSCPPGFARPIDPSEHDKPVPEQQRSPTMAVPQRSSVTKLACGQKVAMSSATATRDDANREARHLWPERAPWPIREAAGLGL